MGFSRQEYWTGLPCPPTGDLPDRGIKPASLMSPALADRFFTTSTNLEARSYSLRTPWIKAFCGEFCFGEASCYSLLLQVQWLPSVGVKTLHYWITFRAQGTVFQIFQGDPGAHILLWRTFGDSHLSGDFHYVCGLWQLLPGKGAPWKRGQSLLPTCSQPGAPGSSLHIICFPSHSSL